MATSKPKQITKAQEFPLAELAIELLKDWENLDNYPEERKAVIEGLKIEIVSARHRAWMGGYEAAKRNIKAAIDNI